MGLNGSDVAKQASDVVLTDDNFQTIVVAVREGRRILNNITRFIVHLMSGNVAEVIALVVCLYIQDVTMRSVYVMSPVEILWLNMITSSPPALGLGLEKADKRIMQRPPPVKNALFTKEVIADIAVYGVLMGGLTLATFFIPFYVLYNGVIGINCNVVSDESYDCDAIYRSRASAYVTLSLLILLHAFNCKNFRKPLWKINVWNNKPLFFTVIGGVALTIPTLYIPTLNTAVFKHKPIDLEWAVVIAALLVFILIGELYKYIKRKMLGKY